MGTASPINRYCCDTEDKQITQHQNTPEEKCQLIKDDVANVISDTDMDAQSLNISSTENELIPNNISENENTNSTNNIKGMLLITLGTFLLMSAYALLKVVSNKFQISLFECIIISNFVEYLIVVCLWFVPSSLTKKPSYVKYWYGEKEYRVSVWCRGFFYWCDVYFYWKGITLVPIGVAETIYFLCPILIAFGAKIFLDEKFSTLFPLVFIFTILGLVIVSQPTWLMNIIGKTTNDSGLYTARSISIYGVILLIMGCVSWAIMSLMVRQAQKAHWLQLEIVSSLQAFLVWTPILVFIDFIIGNYVDFSLGNGGIWTLSFDTALMIIAIGILTGSGLMCTILGYQYGEATKVSWLEYTFLPFGYFYQWVLFNKPPNIFEITGTCLVMVTCVLSVIEQFCTRK
eukprot:498662_1